MRALRSLRGRVALLATLAVASVLLVVGATAVASFADRERARVDDELRSRPVGALVRAVARAPGPGIPVPAPGEVPREGPAPGPLGGPPGGDRLGPAALRPEGEYIRLIESGEVARSVDVPRGVPTPERPGLRTVRGDGDRYRSLTRQGPGDVLLEVGTDLEPAEDRIASLRNRLLLLGALGLLLTAALSWWFAGLALRPLRALRDAAGSVTTTRDLSTRLPADSAPEEVSQLSGSINSMLGRLERSAGETDSALEATRRFAGDAGHELRTPMTALRANLGALRRNPDLSPDERGAALEDAEHEAGRAARLLDVLQTLARGDAGAALPHETVDLSEVAETAVEAARGRHPEVEWRLEAAPEALQLEGWPDGLRALIDNLLENAARHGRKGGHVELGLARDDGAIAVTVDDDGPGVTEADRERIFERFARGGGARGDGSGLGLALVRQQARLHGGEVEVADGPLGGARFAVRLGAAPAS